MNIIRVIQKKAAALTGVIIFLTRLLVFTYRKVRSQKHVAAPTNEALDSCHQKSQFRDALDKTGAVYASNMKRPKKEKYRYVLFLPFPKKNAKKNNSVKQMLIIQKLIMLPKLMMLYFLVFAEMDR